ncbi:hypothetical protein HELRODRAFT_147860, partial [Helobdella robusta]|uniref:Uncharacterized protein n=1 Tax=Helobdella robusta TaxID=6412 RepID=T1EK31_HELRO
IKEGDCVNVDVTGPGAVVALSLMFFNSMNRSVSEWLTTPDTPSLLENVKPDLLMLRTIGYGLVMWKHVEPTMKWIDKNIPKV